MKDTEPTESDKRHNANTDSGQSKGKMSTDTLWKIIAICTGVVIGLVILAVGIWYETRYRKRKSLLPTIVVSKEKLFHKTGNIPADEEGEEGGIKEPSAPTESEARSPVPFRNSLTSHSIPNINHNSTPPPVEQPYNHDE